MDKLLLIFIALQLINVVLSTIRTLITIKGNRLATTLSSAIYYGFYAIVVVYLSYESIDLWAKVLITFATNLIGVDFSMWLMNKMQKDKLWEIVATVVDSETMNCLQVQCELTKTPYNILMTTNNEWVFHIYTKTRQQTKNIKTILVDNGIPHIVHDERVRLS